MKFNEEFVRAHSAIDIEAKTDSQLQVVLDQVLEFFVDKHVPSSDEALALHYAQALYDEIFFQAFGSNPNEDPKEKRIDQIKKWIQIRWGEKREIPKGEIYSKSFLRG